MTTASIITLIRIGFIPVYMFFMHMSEGVVNGWMMAALGLFIFASLTDWVDGYIARKYHQVSDFGKFLDPLADKLLVVSSMLMFCGWGTFPAWALLIVLTREFAITGLRLVAVGKGKVIAAGWSGKVKTACTMVGMCAWMMFPHIATLRVVIMAVVMVTTVYSGIEYFIKNWNCLWDKQ